MGGILRWLTELWDHLQSMYLEGCAASDGVEGDEHGNSLIDKACGGIVCSGAIRGRGLPAYWGCRTWGGE